MNTSKWTQADVDAANERIASAIKKGIPVGLHSMSPDPVIIDLPPIGAPRQSRRDSWDPCTAVIRYRAWKDRFRPACTKAAWELQPTLKAEFEVAMPPSWPKKKKVAMSGQPHQQKPDIDNMCKAIMDAFGKDDGYVHTLNVTKRWAEVGRIIMHR